jgi:vacuolar ATPase assembly integral membrane protein VMA21
MIFVPIGSYFLTVHTIFQGTYLPFPSCMIPYEDILTCLGNSSYAGGLAALLANVVLISYIVVAMNEDQSEQQAGKKKESKKDL